MINWNGILLYVVISGFIMLSWTYCTMNFGKKGEEIDEEIAEASWQTGISEELISSLVMIGMLLFGWALLPYEIISGISDMITGKNRKGE